MLLTQLETETLTVGDGFAKLQRHFGLAYFSENSI